MVPRWELDTDPGNQTNASRTVRLRPYGLTALRPYGHTAIRPIRLWHHAPKKNLQVRVQPPKHRTDPGPGQARAVGERHDGVVVPDERPDRGSERHPVQRRVETGRRHPHAAPRRPAAA